MAAKRRRLIFYVLAPLSEVSGSATVTLDEWGVGGGCFFITITAHSCHSVFLIRSTLLNIPSATKLMMGKFCTTRVKTLS